MNSLKYLLVKEYKQIFRNKALLSIMFVMPIIQLLILPLAADYEIKNINISLVDHDRSTFSNELISKIIASGYFKLTDYGDSYKEAFKQIENGSSDLILEIPQNFEKNLMREKIQKVFIAVNAVNGTKASLGGAYLTSIIASFNQNIDGVTYQGKTPIPIIRAASSNWFNPYLKYYVFMVPAILVLLVTVVGGYVCSLNIVKEKEVGTIEQINVTPIKKHHYILGKLIPFWIIGMVVFSIGFFGVARLIYSIATLGSVVLLYCYLALFLIALLGFGLLISTYADTGQQAMSISFFFMMLFILMSGLFTSIESMPPWAQVIAQLNPVTYFIEVMRMVMLKGAGIAKLKVHFFAIIAFGIFFNGWAILNYSKTSS